VASRVLQVKEKNFSSWVVRQKPAAGLGLYVKSPRLGGGPRVQVWVNSRERGLFESHFAVGKDSFSVLGDCLENGFFTVYPHLHGEGVARHDGFREPAFH